MLEQISTNKQDDEALFASAFDFMVSGEMIYASYLLKKIEKKDDIVSYNLALCFYDMGFSQEAYDEVRLIREKSLIGFDFNFLPSRMLENASLGFAPIRKGCVDQVFSLSLIRLKLAICRKLGLVDEIIRLSSYLPAMKPWKVDF